MNSNTRIGFGERLLVKERPGVDPLLLDIDACIEDD
jgi:hypothetical protein